MKNRGNKNKETWWKIEKHKMKKRETTMKNDEKERKKQWKMMKKRKNNETWWKIEKQQWNMMKNGGKKQWKMMKNKDTPMNNYEK